MVGAYGSDLAPDTEVSEKVAAVASEAERALQEMVSNGVLQAIPDGPLHERILSYKRQVVAGTNYRVKVSLDDEKTATLTIYQPLPHTNEGPRFAGIEINDP
mmetsp:Transcript_19568/g.31489  ORF Transcript_19568/g.31489 Transcript_19568/m.31489 type:complete len:102 (+) Transcript_19568:3-308(+)